MLRPLTTTPARPTAGKSSAPTVTRLPALPIRAPRLLLRPLKRQDLDERQCWPPFNDPLGLIWDMPRAGCRENDRWFSRLTDGRHYLAYGVEDYDGLLIGMLSLRDVRWNRSARLGIAFRSSHVGRGYGSEVLDWFLPYFFLALDFEEMLLDVAAGNRRAVRCYEKLAFERMRSFWRWADGLQDLALLNRPEYADQRVYFRQRWGRVETLYYDMLLRRQRWEGEMYL
ncbi:MAG: GNAT family N-acetyltransferase, partial [Chloroflexia bacterium]|nr:GNAT family N-acetyltransferase [Chloroflexia bacterium]